MGFKPLTYKNAPGEEPHITPEDDAAIYESIVGTDGVFTVGEQFKATVISNNKVRIGNGVLNVGGHMGRTTYGDYVDVTIENGVSEQNRNDLIIARFVIGDTDTYELDVKKGVSGKEAVDPELIQEDLYNGGKTREYPLYRVKIEGLSIVKVEQMLEIRPTIPMLNKYLSDISDKLKADYIVENYVSGDNSAMYRKWNSGLLEVWLASVTVVPVNIAWGNVFRSDSQVGKNYPEKAKFIAPPIVTMTVKTDLSDVAWITPKDSESKTRLPNYYLVRGTRMDATAKYFINAYAVGRWK